MCHVTAMRSVDEVLPSYSCLRLSISIVLTIPRQWQPCEISSSRPIVVLMPQKFALLFTLGQIPGFVRCIKTAVVHGPRAGFRHAAFARFTVLPRKLFGPSWACGVCEARRLCSIRRSGGTSLARHLFSRSRLPFTVTYSASMAAWLPVLREPWLLIIQLVLDGAAATEASIYVGELWACLA